MSDLIGYAVAWKSSTSGDVNVSTTVRPLHEAEVLLAAKKIESSLDYFLIEIYPDSRAIPEVSHV